MKPPGSSARHTPSGNAWARSASRCGTPTTKPRWQTLRDALGEQDFDSAWAEGAALSTDEAIAYAQRGRGERKRPTSGWASLTPTELDVVRLVSEGLANNDIATRLFVSPRTVQIPSHPRLHQAGPDLPGTASPRKLPATPDNCSLDVVRRDKRDVVGGCTTSRQSAPGRHHRSESVAAVAVSRRRRRPRRQPAQE